MLRITKRHDLLVTGRTLLIGSIGAWIANVINAPIAVLTGPAVLVALSALIGLKTGIDESVRNITFLIVGIGIGSGMNSGATEAILKWPLAFAILGITLCATLWICGRVLEYGFGIPRQSAYLAAAPGHLSFVVSLSSALELDTTRIVVIQSVRIMALTLSAPVIAMAFGFDLNVQIIPSGILISWIHLGLLSIIGLIIGYVFDKVGLPAALLIAGMVVSTVGHSTSLTPGVLHPWMNLIGLVIIGALIGARFNGITRSALLQSLIAGLTTTAITVIMVIFAVILVAYLLSLESTHVLVAFAPGGLEAMIVMGAVIGANPGFVSACHIARLLFLTMLIPAFVGRIKLK